MTNEESIMAVHERWLDAEIAQDKKALEKLLHDEVLCIVPGGRRIMGKRQLLDYLNEGEIEIERIKSFNLWIKVDLDFAVKVADFETRFVDHRIPVVAGTHTWCLRKELDEWKIQMITWTIKGEPVDGVDGTR